jgi:alpha-glucosidase
VPIPWSGRSAPFGFGPSGEPWLPQPAEWADLTAERQVADTGSMLSLYRDALRLRGQLPALGDGTLSWLAAGDDVLAFRRDPGFVCVVNLGDAPVKPPEEVPASAEILLASGPVTPGGTIPVDTAVWYRVAH